MLKILILRFSSIGDIVLTTPVIRILKTQLPNATVHYCTKEKFKIILEGNPYLDKIFTISDDLNALVENLKNEKYDFIVDLHNNLRTWTIKNKLGIKSFTFDKLNLEKWFLVNFKIDYLPKVHIVDRYLDAIKLLDVSNDQKGLDYFIPETDIININSFPGNFQSGYAAFAIGAQHFTKKLPLNKLIEFCEQINLPVILLGGKEDYAVAEEVLSIQTNVIGKAIINKCGEYNLNQSASVIQQSEIVFTHDTGLMHIAAALKKNVVSIWGSTVPEFGMYPYQTNYQVIENKNLSCRPCSKIGYKKCPLGHFKCMNDLNLNLK